MLVTSHSKPAGCLMLCLVFGFVCVHLPEANAQYSNCWSCSDQQVSLPIYLQFGVDPYNPRQIHYRPFTPLQLNPYPTYGGSGCQSCETMTNSTSSMLSQPDGITYRAQPADAAALELIVKGNSYQTQPANDLDVGRIVESNVANANEPAVPKTLEAKTTDVPNISRVPQDGRNPDTKPNAASRRPASSPSDIQLSPNKSTQPTLADDASSENMAQLDQARKQIARLKAEVSEAKKQAVAAMDRASAAEKKASEATSVAEDSRRQAIEEQSRLVNLAEKKVDDLLEKIRELEQRSADNNAGGSSRSAAGTSDAEQRVAKLFAEAEKASQENQDAARPGKQQKVGGAKKKNPVDVPPQKQIENLQQAMTRQIKNSNEKIRKRNQALRKKMIDDGKDESDPEVKELEDRLNKELEENEAKIRQRVEQRIKRIRKEAAGQTER